MPVEKAIGKIIDEVSADIHNESLDLAKSIRSNAMIVLANAI
jgi:hypothetical protein